MPKKEAPAFVIQGDLTPALSVLAGEAAATVLYKLYDTSDTLLYVGVSEDPIRRWSQHATSKPWWQQVTRCELVWHHTRHAALLAEKLAIREEMPKHNGTHSVVPGAVEAEQELADWAQIWNDRDARVRRAYASGMEKMRIHTITGISRATIDRILKENAMPGTQLFGWGSYDLGEMTLEDCVRVYLGDYVEDYDTEALSTAFRAAINELLAPNEIVLAGSDFYSRVYPAPENSSDLIRQAVKGVDLGKLAAKFDRS